MTFDLTSPAGPSGVRLELQSANDDHPGWALIDNVADAVSSTSVEPFGHLG
jgi:hypothetical protein